MAKKATTRRTNTTAATTTAPAEINKAEAIRNYHTEHPEAGPSAIAKALGEQGIEVNASRVSTVLRGPRKSGGLDVDTIKIAADFAKSYDGSAADAKEAIEKLGSFIDKCGSTRKALEALDAYQAVADSIG